MAVIEDTVMDIPALVSKITTLQPLRRFWFRGQGCQSRNLMPSLWRKLTTSNGANLVTPGQVLNMEQRLITRFRQRSLPFWPAGYPQSDWEHLFAMQHYGIPTRLLDWTTNLLMGVFFSLDHDLSTCGCGTGSCLPTIWVLDPIMLNRSNPRLDGVPVEVLATSDGHINSWEPGVSETLFAPAPIAMYGTYNNERITAQHGSFTVGGRNVVSVNEAAKDFDDRVLYKITLTGPREDLSHQLKLLGVSRAAVYPSLDELARDITEEEFA